MFKKFDQSAVSSRSQVKSSVVRGIRAALIEQYPLIEDVIDDILPKKDISMAKCQNHVNILCALCRRILRLAAPARPHRPLAPAAAQIKLSPSQSPL